MTPKPTHQSYGASLFEYSASASTFMPSFHIQPSQFKFEEAVLSQHLQMNGENTFGINQTEKKLSLSTNSRQKSADTKKDYINVEEESTKKSTDSTKPSVKDDYNEWISLEFMHEQEIEKILNNF